MSKINVSSHILGSWLAVTTKPEWRNPLYLAKLLGSKRCPISLADNPIRTIGPRAEWYSEGSPSELDDGNGENPG